MRDVRPSQTYISRRRFLGLSYAFAGTGLATITLPGCRSWIPRSQNSDSPNEESSATSSIAEASINDDLVFIEGGTFLMGSPENEPWRGDDEIQHEVTVSDFYLSSTEVTNSEYEALMGSNPSAFKEANLPVENVTWLDAVTYCNALSDSAGLDAAYIIAGENVSWDRAANGYRLPTEAEWEYACRAGTTTPFNTENSIDADTQANYYGTYPYEIENNYFSQGNLDTSPGVYRQTTIEEGSFPANAWGLFDMHGNVGEWVWDAYSAYDPSSQSDPTGPSEGTLRINRGGGWSDFGKNLRSAYRATLPADGSSSSVGFGIARNASAGVGVVGNAAAASASTSGDDTLIVYFSWSGNTRSIANRISEMTGLRAVELELEHPYSTNYNTCLDEAQRDQNTQARPALKTRIDDMGRYGTIILGYPNWWASIPMPIATFLESYDFAGKAILPFSSNGGGGLGQSVSAISKLVPEAIAKDGLSVYYGGGSTLDSDLTSWLKSNGVALR